MVGYRFILLGMSLGVLGGFIGCQRPAPELVGATVDIIDLYPGNMKPARVEITDVSEVNKLASFFPELREGRDSGRGGGWMAQVRITFRTKGGEGVTVFVDPDFEFWNVKGYGDWNLSSEFKPYLLKLVKSDSTRSPK